MNDGTMPYNLKLCDDGHDDYECDKCSACRVWWDRLLERGCATAIDGNFISGKKYNPQSEWEFRDIAEIALAIDDGTDETNYCWIIAVRVNEHDPLQWFAVRGGHDYTGWDCQSSLRSERYESKEAAFRTLVDWEREELERRYATGEATR